jgi:hypothetical protein
MGQRTTCRTLISGALFVASVMIGTDVTAQAVAHPQGKSKQSDSAKGGQRDSAAEHNPACQSIIGECKKLGFIQGQWKTDNGLWKDCFYPIAKGDTTATRDGKPISVPVAASDVRACRAALNFKTKSDSTPKLHPSSH